VEQDTPQYWFPVKRYGWGWGLPVRWQGWVALALYFGSIYAGVRYFRPRDSVAGFLVWLAIATIIFVAVVAWKGERPLAWRWGDER
jgi:hypothetical protein